MKPVIPPPDAAEATKQLTIFHAALLIGQVLFAVVAYFLVSTGHFTVPGLGYDSLFYLIIPVFLAGGIVASFTFLSFRKKAIHEDTDPHSRINAYRSALIVSWALLEGPSFLATTVYLITGNLLYIGLAGVVILVFIYLRPTKTKTEEVLNA